MHLAYLLSLQRERLRLERRIGPDSRGRARARARALVERRRRRKEGGGKKGRSSARETRQAGVYRRGGVAAREPPRRGGTTEQRRRRAAVGGGGGGGEARVRRHRRFWRGRVGLGRVRVVRVPCLGTASSRHLRMGPRQRAAWLQSVPLPCRRRSRSHTASGLLSFLSRVGVAHTFAAQHHV